MPIINLLSAVAERIASERGENVGDSVGYKVLHYLTIALWLYTNLPLFHIHSSSCVSTYMTCFTVLYKII